MFERLLAFSLLAFLAGCGKQPAAPPPAKPAVQDAASTSPAAAESAGNAAAEAASLGEAQIETVLQELTQAVRRYAVEQQRVPKSLEELVGQGYLSNVPPAPAGKRFAIDRNLRVYLARQ